MQLWQYCLLVTARLLYMFRTLSASIIRSTKTVVAATGACHCLVATVVVTDLGHPYWIHIIPNNDMHQLLLLQFLYS